MAKISRTQNVNYDITHATDDELEAIRNDVLRNLTRRALEERQPGMEMIPTHDRHYSAHSRG